MRSLVLKDHNTTIATWVHNEGVGTVQNDPAAVPPIERYERNRGSRYVEAIPGSHSGTRRPHRRRSFEV